MLETRIKVRIKKETYWCLKNIPRWKKKKKIDGKEKPVIKNLVFQVNPFCLKTLQKKKTLSAKLYNVMPGSVLEQNNIKALLHWIDNE